MNPLLIRAVPGVPRDQITVPICRSTAPSDSVLYDSPQGTVVYWLPRWRVIVPVGGLPQIEFVQQAAGWTLTVHLEPYPADSVKDQVAAATILPATFGVSLRYNLPGAAGSTSGPVLSVLDATMVTHDGANLVVQFQGTDSSVLDRLFGAMTSLDRGTNLAISQLITVAVPAPRFEPFPIVAAQVQMTSVANMMLRISPGIGSPPIDPPVTEPRPRPRPDPLPRPIDPLPEFERFRAVSVAVEDDEAFYYPADRYPSIYQGITFGTPVFTRTRREVMFGGVPYPYYQDPGQSATFYYLPDGFKLARVLTAPHVPALTAVFSNMEQAEDQISCQLAFVALPTIREERLDAARIALTAFAPGPYPPGLTGPDLQPMAVESGALNLSLQIPRSQVAPQPPGGPGDTHLVSLSTGIIDSETMALADFRTAYGALFGGVGTLTGLVQVTLGPSLAETVPVSVRVTDTAGPIVDVNATPLDDVSAKVTITNACESTVTFGALSASIWRGAAGAMPTDVTATATQMQSPLPVSLDPGASWSFVAVAASGVPGAGALNVTVNTPDLAIMADPARVWDSVFAASSAPTSYEKPVTVRIPTDIFVANSAHPSLKSVIVSFQTGDAVSFDAATAAGLPPGTLLWTSQVKVPVPVRDYVVPTVDPGTYRYKVRALTTADTIYEDVDWRTNNSNILDISLPPFVQQTEDIVSQLNDVDPGTTGPQVRRVQALLRAADTQLTDNDLAIDGEFGPITERQVKAFQQANGVDANGVVGADTWRKLLGL